MKQYIEGIEKEKVMECQKALERQKICNGMLCTKEDEIKLQQIQIMQIEDKNYKEMEQKHVEMMWHQVLLDDVKQKELKERIKAEKIKQEMLDRRKSYDEQILTANRKKQEIKMQDREKENKRLDKMKKKMEDDHFMDLKRKKEKQLNNKNNFIEGHELKLLKLKEEKMKAREIDNNTIREALHEVQKEKERKRTLMKNLQMEKEVFTDCFNRERAEANKIDQDTNRIIQDWLIEESSRATKHLREIESEKHRNREKAKEEYKAHIHERNIQLQKERREQNETMEQVRKAAVEELKKKMDNANEELRQQIEYRNNLDKQIKENQRILESELIKEANVQRPYTKKSELFSDAMRRVDCSPGRLSTNPVHPFRRIIETSRKKSENNVHLPLIGHDNRINKL